MPIVLATPEAQSFRGLARAYCEIIDARASGSAIDFLKAAHQLLPALYAAAIALPEVEPDSDSESAVLATTSELRDSLARFLGKWDLYSLVLDPYDNKEIAMSSLGGDLAEIYEDLRDGEHHEAVAGTSHPNDVMWEWRLAFSSHWSRHASAALGAMQAALLTHYADETAHRQS